MFTKVPVIDRLRYIADLFPPDITQLSKHCLTTSYFVWNSSFYEQTDGVATGSQLNPVVANLFMERFESLTIERAVDKPTVRWSLEGSRIALLVRPDIEHFAHMDIVNDFGVKFTPNPKIITCLRSMTPPALCASGATMVGSKCIREEGILLDRIGSGAVDGMNICTSTYIFSNSHGYYAVEHFVLSLVEIGSSANGILV
ncbi:hypothetical protein Trydic_g19628 [Trypoxylus dichotomus]